MLCNLMFFFPRYQILVFSLCPVREVYSDIFIFCSGHMEQIVSWSVSSTMKTFIVEFSNGQMKVTYFGLKMNIQRENFDIL